MSVKIYYNKGLNKIHVKSVPEEKVNLTIRELETRKYKVLATQYSMPEYNRYNKYEV